MNLKTCWVQCSGWALVSLSKFVHPHDTLANSHNIFTRGEMRDIRYVNLIRTLSSYHLLRTHPIDPSLHDSFEKLLLRIPQMTLEQRKQIISLSRTSETVDLTSIYFQRIKSFFTNSLFNMLLLYRTPFLRSLLLFCARNAPITDRDMKQQYKESFQKEYNVLVSTPKPEEIDFTPLFHEDIYQPIHRTLMANPRAAIEVNSIIREWINNVRDLPTIYPKLSSKTVSKESEVCLEKEGYLNDSRIRSRYISQVTLERVYHFFGHKIQTNNEMRQVYYPSVFSVRTYYATGGSSFHKTKYLSNIFAALCDLLPPTHRRLRMIPNRLKVKKGQHALCYDFSSYTTNLWEHNSMLRSLSRACVNVDVRIMDVRHGPIMVSLEDLINDLIEAQTLPLINIKASICGVFNFIVSNRVAGLLGIGANIPTASFLHGIVALQLTIDSTVEETNDLGDDGIILTDSQREPSQLQGLSLIGEFSRDKMYCTDKPGCLHLKRSIVQTSLGLLSFPNVDFPSFEYTKKDSDLDPRYKARIKPKKKKDRLSATASSILTFLKSLRFIKIDDQDRVLIISLLNILYDWYNLPVCGSVPQFMNSTESYFCCVRPTMGYDFSCDPIERTIYSQTAPISKLPRRIRVTKSTDLRDCRVGNIFESNGSKLLTLLIQLGYLKRSVIYDLVCGDSTYFQTYMEYKSKHLYSCYTFEVVLELPPMLIQIDYMV